MQDSERAGNTRGYVPPGDKVVRLERRRKRRRLRVVPNIPGVVRFLIDIINETPFLPLIVILVVLWVVFSVGIHLVENPVNQQFDSFRHTLWWSFTAMQTQGANAPGPITHLGILLGTIWSIIGTVIFFGVIISTIYSYYMIPWKRKHSQPILEACQYNLNELEYLSIEELNTLKATLNNIVDTRIKDLEKGGSS